MVIRLLNNPDFYDSNNQNIKMNKVKGNEFKYAKLNKNRIKFDSCEMKAKRIAKKDLKRINEDRNFWIIENDVGKFLSLQEINGSIAFPILFKDSEIYLKSINEISGKDTVLFFDNSVSLLYKKGKIKNVYELSMNEFNMKEKISEYLLKMDNNSIIINEFILFGK